MQSREKLEKVFYIELIFLDSFYPKIYSMLVCMTIAVLLAELQSKKHNF